MYYLFITLIIIAAILLVFIVLIQNPKGGGLTSGFASSTNLMGVQRTGDILEKGTWILIVSIMVFSLLVNVTNPEGGSDSQGIELQQQINPTSAPISPLNNAPGQAAPPAVQPSAGDTVQ